VADLRITELAALAGGDLSGEDLLAVADISASETKKITVVDLLGNGVTLIADATIPGAKIVFGAGTLAGSAIADEGISATQLAADAVTAAKLGDESTVDLVTTLPGSGAFIGQIALNTDDNKGYIWNGSSWVNFKAAGSVNTVVGDTAGVVNLSVTTSGDTVTITTSLDASTNAAEFLAGPTAAAGAVSYRQIASGDMPTAAAGGKGAVLVNGAGLAMSGDQIVINNTVAASGATYSVVQYSDKGLVVNGRFISAADLPEATSVNKGAVLPGSGLSVAAGGALNHTNSVTAGTAAKITFDAQGHVTASQALLDTDIPDLPASKLTTGTISASVIGTNTITGNKLANASTTKFGGAASTEGIVSFPAADFTGQYFFDSINGDLYLWDGNAWQPITITAGEIVFAGTYNATTNLVASVTAAGTAAGLTVGSALPAAAAANTRYYLVVSIAGTGTAPAPTVALAPPDMLLSNGTSWQEIDVSGTISAQTATNISFTPTGGIAASNVQSALVELDTEKLALAGGTVTGELLIGAAGSLVLEGSTADGFETTIAVVDPTADRTITLPNVTGTVITTADSGTVTSAMIADGTVLNADINASAAIAGTKISPDFGGQTVKTTGVFSAADGTAAAPSVTFTNDIDTGLYSAAANTLGIATNGVGHVFINATGQVGVNTASPSASLDISGNQFFSAANPQIQFNAGGPIIRLPSANTLAFLSDSTTERFRFSAAGALGIAGANYGTSGQVLTSAGSAAAPTWTTISAGAGDVVLASNNAFTGANTFTNATGQTFRQAATQDGVVLRGRAGGTTSLSVEIVPTTLTVSRTLTAPNVDGTIITTGDSGTVTSTMLAGSIADSKLSTISTAGKVANAATTATSSDTASTIVLRDGSNGFSAGAITAANINVDATTIPATGIYRPGTNILGFATASTQRMQINAAGSLLFAQTTTQTPGFGNTTTGACLEAATSGLFLSRADAGVNLSINNNGSGTIESVSIRRSNSQVGSIATTATTTAYNTSSDYRLKENVVPVVGGITRLQQLKPSRFNFITDPGKVVDGFLAHEAAAVVPECVTGAKDAVGSNGIPIYQGIDQSKLVPLLTAALQEAVAEINALKARVAALELN
jgi:hypothetical protein